MKDVESSLTNILQRLSLDASDEFAWLNLYKQLYPFVMAVLLRKMKGVPINFVEDAAQDVFLRILKRRPFNEIKDESSFRSYVGKIASNVAITQVISLIKNKKYHVNIDDLSYELPHTNNRPPDDALMLDDILDIANEKLDEKDLVLLGLLLSGHTLGEISERLGVSYSAVGVRAYRLKRSLSKAMDLKENK